jgi:hypothetical protein
MIYSTEHQIADAINWDGVAVEHQYANVYRVQLPLVDEDQYEAAGQAVVDAQYTIMGGSLRALEYTAYAWIYIAVQS